MLTRLIYTSNASPSLKGKDIVQIAARADQRNLDSNLTGLLIHGAGRFLQVLEGAREDVWETYARIERDDRHSDLRVIEFREVSERSFDRWRMQLLELSDLDPHELSSLLSKWGASTTFAPAQMSSDDCNRFMTELSRNYLSISAP